MLVDPNTGAPISDQGYSLGDMAGQAFNPGRNTASTMVDDMAVNMGMTSRDSFVSKVLQTVPSTSKTTLWNMFRGSRTIAYGSGKQVERIGSLNATLNPRYWGRMPSMKSMGGRSVKLQEKVHPFSGRKLAEGEVYTPFGFLAPTGNKIVSKIGAITNNMLKTGSLKEVNGVKQGFSAAREEMAKTKMGRMGLRFRDYAREGEAFTPGALSRITAADKMVRGKLPTSNVMNFLKQTDKDLLDKFKIVKANRYQAEHIFNTKTVPTSIPLSFVEGTSDDAARLTYASVNGSISGRVSGFMSQIKMGNRGMDAVKAAEASGNKAFMAGTEAAERFMKKGGFKVSEEAAGKLVAREGGYFAEKMGIKVGEKVGWKVAGRAMLEKEGFKAGSKLAIALGLNAAPVVGQVASALMLADMAMDIGKLGVEGFKSGLDFAKEGAISYKGSINKGVMGMGYRDNTVAATSRARGVQAIQNSRLNARSILGSEAGAMAAHFG